MKTVPSALALGLAAGVFAVIVGNGVTSRAPAADERIASPAVSQVRGAGSCSAIACHGGVAPRRGNVFRNEHTTWISNDKHAMAYQTLFSKRSEQIAKGLARTDREFKPAHVDLRCLACHTTPRPEPEARETAWMNQDGVGCESCHGPAGRWIGRHTDPGWIASQNAPWKESFGFTNTKNLATRAKVCTNCHIGSSDGPVAREVTHDMIAAGHPRLNFELSAYLANEPPHWREKGNLASPANPLEPVADFSVRAWAVGQIASVRAAVGLLESRSASLPASRRGGRPEFSDYGCFSCHHALRDEEWRGDAAGSAVAPGSLPWRTWELALARFVLDTPGLGDREGGGNAIEAIAALETLQAGLGADRARVSAAANEAARELDNALARAESKQFTERELKSIAARLNDPESLRAPASWDAAAQRYLALSALLRSLERTAPSGSPEQSSIRKRLDDLYERVRFKPGFDGPVGFDPRKP